MAFGTLRDELDVERGENFIDTGPDSMHVLKESLLEKTYVDCYFETIFLLIFALQFLIIIIVFVLF